MRGPREAPGRQLAGEVASAAVKRHEREVALENERLAAGVDAAHS